jgi:hypothetical protein
VLYWDSDTGKSVVWARCARAPTRRHGQPHGQYARELGLTFPLILDLQGDIARAYGVIGLPTTFVVGRDGRPVALDIGARAWGSAEAQALIQALLAEPVAQAR